MTNGFGDMGSLLKQAQKMQRQMAKLREELKERVVEGTAGGGVVKVHVNGLGELLAIKIAPEAVDPKDLSMLEDLVVSAVQVGLKKAQDLHQDEMGKLTGGLNLPGLF